jgi:hypothetical protein
MARPTQTAVSIPLEALVMAEASTPAEAEAGREEATVVEQRRLGSLGTAFRTLSRRTAPTGWTTIGTCWWIAKIQLVLVERNAPYRRRIAPMGLTTMVTVESIASILTAGQPPPVLARTAATGRTTMGTVALIVWIRTATGHRGARGLRTARTVWMTTGTGGLSSTFPTRGILGIAA